MKRPIAVMILLLGSLFTIPVITSPVHAAFTGVVCLTLPTSTRCPQIPFTFSNTVVGSSFTVGVFIDGSAAMGGFDIYVKSDPAFLNPTGAALGGLIVNPSLTSICINGIATTGACTVNTANGPGVVEVTTAEGSGTNECGGISPCSGLAFTITYRVVASTASTSLSYPIAAGCSASSVSSPPNVCVEVADNIGTVLPETTMAGDFNDKTPSANFVASPTTGLAPLSVNFDATLSNATSGNTITSYNWAFGDAVTANVTTPKTSHTYTAAGTYTPNLEIVDSSGSKSSIKSGPIITVGIPDFSINSNTTSLFFLPGKNRNATISLTSLSGFSGLVGLSANSSTTLGITSTLNHPSVSLAAGTTDTSTRLTVSSTTTTPIGSYIVNVTGTSGTLKHTVFITINVVRLFYSLSNTGAISTIRGGSGTNNVTMTLTSGTAQAVTPSCINLPTGASCSFAPANVIPAITGNSTRLTISTTTSTPSGSFQITVTGSPQHPTNTTFPLIVADFNILANPGSVSIPQAGNGASVISFTSLSQFSGNIAISVKSTSPNIIAFLNRTSVTVTPTRSDSSSLFVIVQTGTLPSSYNVTVSGTLGSLIHRLNVTINVPIPSFGASATPTTVSVKTGTNGTSAITLIGLNGFTGTINLLAKAPPNVGITTVFSSTSVMVNITSGPVTSTLTITTISATPSGTYTITVNGTTTNIFRLVNVTLTVISPLPSIQVGSASLSTISTTAGQSVTMTVTASNTGSVPVNLTVTMDVNSGSGTNVTVAQKTITLNPGQAAQTFVLTWNTTQWSGGNYHVYARVIGSQTNAVNQSQSAGTVTLSLPPQPPPGTNLSLIPWVTTGIAAAIAALFGLLLFRRRRPTGTTESM